ncbi:MAG: multicopper oxidase domain-containing protein [Scytolyngbya sp. HA4215-MV1]|nr:multicopper oxidase domain-containing protein [Scytolyngbya sp. HA4215-MV1]
MKITRRQVLKYAAIAGGSILLPLGMEKAVFGAFPTTPNPGKPFTLTFKVPPILSPVRSDSTTDYYQIEVKTGLQEIIPGKLTRINGYAGIFPAPRIRQKKGRQSVVRFINRLVDNTPTSIHLHGMASLPEYDGWANDVIPPRDAQGRYYYKDYIYPNNRPATLWYHDHAVHQTARNVYSGLSAGMYVVYDDHELDLNLPSGDYDVPLILHDKVFDRQGQVVFDDQGEFSVYGDVITVNGVAWPRMPVERRKYRFRMLNASVSRSYNLRLDNGDSFIMIGTDAGLRNSPAAVKNFTIGMAERYEFVLDFSQYPIGTQIQLRNNSPLNNETFTNTNKVMMFEVVSDPVTPDTSEIPSTLGFVPPVSELLSQVVRTREFRYARNNGLWTVNGRTWSQTDMEANPGQNQVEIWSLINESGGWFHPVHIHLSDFLIIDRNGRKPFTWEEGWKDVFYLTENSVVRVVGKFGPHSGRYMTHCHNLVHEDNDMMRGFQVGSNSNNPAAIAPAKVYTANTPPL